MIKAYPSLFLLFFVVLGILLGDYLAVSPLIGLAAAALAAGLAVATFLRNRRTGAALLAGCALGLVTAANFGLQLRGIGPNHISNILREPTLCQVCGRVSDWPDLKQGRTEIEIRIDSLTPTNPPGATFREVGGSLLLKVSDTTTAFQRGDHIAFVVRVYPVRWGDRESEYGRYLNLRGIFVQAFLPTVLNVQIDRRPIVGFWPLVDWVRGTVCGSLQRNLSPTASALARGFLIGETRDIPNEIYGRFRDTGTLHVLAVSGANVALVLMFFLWTMRPFWLGPRARSLVLLAVILVFAGVSYGDPSVVRASIMAALVLGARLLGRVYDLNNIIAATASIILLVRPTELFDVGFQLSFATAWGLIFFVPKIGEAFARIRERRWYPWLVIPILVSIVAQLVSSPLILLYFERLPVISIVANLVVVPAVSIGVIGVMILIVADFIWPLLGALVGSLVDLWLQGVLAALEYFGGTGAPVWKSSFLTSTPWGGVLVVLFYLMLVVSVVAIKRKAARRMLVILTVLIVNTALAVGLVASYLQPEAEFRVERVPGGLAVLVTTDLSSPSELVITGLVRTSGSSGGTAVESVLRRHGVERLRRLIVLGADYDALGDILQLARKYTVDSVCVPRRLEQSLGDLQGRGDSTSYRGPVLVFEGRLGQPTGPGCYLGDDGVTYESSSFRVDIVDRLRTASLPPPTPGLASVLIIGGRWQPEADEWLRYRRAGYGQIICSDFEQPGQSSWPDAELDPDAVPPDYVVDLSKRGGARLTFGL